METMSESHKSSLSLMQNFPELVATWCSRERNRASNARRVGAFLWVSSVCFVVCVVFAEENMDESVE